MTTAIRIESVSKLYRLGTVGTGTIAHDLNRWWHTIRGKEDPYAKVGQVNDRTKGAKSEERRAESDGASSPGSSLSALRSRASGLDYVWALREINLEVQQGEVLGIIGRNGAGKSTLLKLLSRVTAPTTGSIKTKGRIASLLEVGTGFHPDLTGRENIYMNGAILGMRRHEITRQLDEIVEFSGCAKYLDTPVKRYSSGMTVRLGFAVAAHLNCEILIVDEVLAVGDAEFQRKCIGKLRESSVCDGKTVLFVSHNMSAVSSICSSCSYVQSGTAMEPMSPSEAISLYLRSCESNSSPTGKLRTGTKDGFGVDLIEIEGPVPGSPLVTGKPFSVTFRTTAADPEVEDKVLCFSVSIVDEYGNPIFLHHTRMSGFQIHPSRLPEKIVFSAPLLPLIPGSYGLEFSLYDDHINLIQKSEIPIAFTVNEGQVYETNHLPPRTHGHLVIPGATWRQEVHLNELSEVSPQTNIKRRDT